MDNEVLKIIASEMPLTDELKRIIEEVTVLKKFTKGMILLKQGELSKEQFIVFKGCIRSYLLYDGEEKTLEFYTEGQPVKPINYGSNIPSTHYLDCIEDTIVCVNTPEYEKEVALKYPQLSSVCYAKHAVSDKILSENQSSYINYRTTTAEERYLKLIIERPDLIQRVPQYQLASYLGIKPGSLSRIRKRLFKK